MATRFVNTGNRRFIPVDLLEPAFLFLSQTVGRLTRAAGLEREVYREVMSDRKASSQAILVVMAVAIAPAFVALSSSFNLAQLLGSVFLALVGWALWTSVIYLVGRRFLDLDSRGVGWKALFRAMGFAHAPGFLRIFGIVPGLNLPVALVTIVWVALATIVALRSANDEKSMLAIVGVIAFGIVPYISVMVFLNLLVLGQSV